MIHKKYIDAYKSIKAPETLHDRIIASSASSDASGTRRTRSLPRPVIAAASLAASLAIVAVAVIALRAGGGDTGAYIAYNGQAVETSAAINMSDTLNIKSFDIGMSASGGIRFEAHITETTTVTVSDGTVTLVDENGIATDMGDLLTLSGDKDSYIVHWQADFYKASASEPFSLVLADSHGSVTYTLKDSDGELTLTKSNKN